MMKYSCSPEIKTKLEKLKFKTVIHFYEISSESLDRLESNEKNYVFIIEDGKHLFDLLSYKPIGFIRKQHFDEDVKSIENLKPVQSTLLTFNNGGNKIMVSSDKIIYLEAQAHYVIIKTTVAMFRVREKISELMERLQPYGFKQVHRSYLINENYVVAYKHDSVILTENVSVPLSKKYKL